MEHNSQAGSAGQTCGSSDDVLSAMSADEPAGPASPTPSRPVASEARVESEVVETPRTRFCSHCGTLVWADSSFCHSCGCRQRPPPTPPPPRHDGPHGPRRVSIGSTFPAFSNGHTPADPGDIGTQRASLRRSLSGHALMQGGSLRKLERAASGLRQSLEQLSLDAEFWCSLLRQTDAFGSFGHERSASFRMAPRPAAQQRRHTATLLQAPLASWFTSSNGLLTSPTMSSRRHSQDIALGRREKSPPVSPGGSSIDRGRDALEMGWRVDALENVLLSQDGYDLTPERLRTVYARFDAATLGESATGKGALLAACEYMGISLPAQAARRLSAILGDAPISFDEFCCVVTKLKLAELCSGEYYESDDEMERVESDEQPRFVDLTSKAKSAWTPMWVVDYEANGSKQDQLVHRSETRKFLFGHRVDEQAIRWVHLDRPNHVMLLRITVKYHLHPLAVDDALTGEGTKFDRYGHNYAFSCDVAQCVKRPLPIEPGRAPGRVRVKWSHACVFFAGRSQGMSTVITAHTTPADTLENTHDIWEDLREQIGSTHTRIRENKGDYLVYKVVQHVADELRFVTSAYRARLDYFRSKIATLNPLQQRQHQPMLLEVSQIDLEIGELLRSVRPLRQLLQHLIDGGEECIGADVRMYLTDVAGELLEDADDFAQLRDVCKLIEEQWQRLLESLDRDSDRQLNDMLSLLTIATTIFAPAQFLCGVYGMNFVHDDATPSIPELRWHHGYLFFWVACIAWFIVSGCGAWFLFRGRKRKPPAPKGSWIGSGVAKVVPVLEPMGDSD
eukprot:TRINITY_DN9747_c0_g1_i1.p1 TRINITY_DN9747_c0_g1~~TRINITY_DN9747_c0_g1_i1.p1  ORF type:complete len:790 (+),score=241.39 TRINITY_DN9747_c0_g1_i1:80-2449(+)